MAASKSLLAALVLATLMALAVADKPSQSQTSQVDPVCLGTAADFAILTMAGISTLPASVITGDIGVSPIAATAMTGFSLVMDPSNDFSTSTQVTGKCYAADYATPPGINDTPAKMTAAIGDMMTAYTDAAGRAISDDANLNINNGVATKIGGLTFYEGVYKWGSNVKFDSDITLSGDSSRQMPVGQPVGLDLYQRSSVCHPKPQTSNPQSCNSLFIYQITGNLVAGLGARVRPSSSHTSAKKHQQAVHMVSC